MTIARINGTPKEKIAWLVENINWLSKDFIVNGNLPLDGNGVHFIVLGENGQWWIEENDAAYPSK